MSNTITILPAEIQELSARVEQSKQQEVGKILKEIFTQTSNWSKEIEAIKVDSIEDKTSMQKAKELRLKVKNARVEAEKQFDSKRAEVQIKMVDFKTEDTLWLKAKQSMQAITKGIEEKAEWQEKFAERFEAEQKRARTQTRLAQIREFKPETLERDVENLSDEMFDTLLAGIKKAHKDKIEADKLAEIQIKELQIKQNRLGDRRAVAFEFGHFFDLDLSTDPSEEVFQKALRSAQEKFEADNIEKAKLKADLDKANKEKADREAQDRKILADQQAKEKADLQTKLQQEETQSLAREQEEKDRKNGEYKKWLKDNKFNQLTDEIKPAGEGNYILYRKIAELKIK